ncbi:hypothetical protein FA13DRAFT_1148691 [Coprinellus micaceus]|uniref:Uncharacterized protein n=1 Tax=Coprinellus micaceus TaxID=71717 RepID=A0A4Y7SUQ6_COPMI|nr:hypothetical protein FA13DRAFT_1148691 [Coprinellus micaceus]
MDTWRGRIRGEHQSRWAVDEWDGAVFGVGTFPLFVFTYALASILIASRASSLLPSSTVYHPSRHLYACLVLLSGSFHTFLSSTASYTRVFVFLRVAFEPGRSS